MTLTGEEKMPRNPQEAWGSREGVSGTMAAPQPQGCPRPNPRTCAYAT